MPPLEVKTERDYDLFRHQPVVRIIYRPTGERRWRRFVVVPDDTQTEADIEAYADTIARLHFEGAYT